MEIGRSQHHQETSTKFKIDFIVWKFVRSTSSLVKLSGLK